LQCCRVVWHVSPRPVLRRRPLEVGLTFLVFPESNAVVFLGSLLLQLAIPRNHYCFAGTHRQPRYLRSGSSLRAGLERILRHNECTAYEPCRNPTRKPSTSNGSLAIDTLESLFVDGREMATIDNANSAGVDLVQSS